MILVQQYRILHHDVSVNNMMVVPYQGGARNSRAPSNDAPDSEDRSLKQAPSPNLPAPAPADEGQTPSPNSPASADEGQALSRTELVQCGEHG